MKPQLCFFLKKPSLVFGSRKRFLWQIQNRTCLKPGGNFQSNCVTLRLFKIAKLDSSGIWPEPEDADVDVGYLAKRSLSAGGV